MGQKIITQTQSPDVDVFTSRYLQSQNIRLVEHYDGTLSKTLIVVKNQIPFVMKIFSKAELTPEQENLFNNETQKLKDIYKQIHPNILQIQPEFNLKGIVPLINIDNQNKTAAILIRQYLTYNLRERIYIEPYLTYIDKIWLTLQIMFSLHNVHSKQVYHGNLKLQNILLTSYMTVFISDIATYKPAYIPIDDNTYYTYYFGHHKESIRTCYLAPERFLEKTEYEEIKKENKLDSKTAAMDVFSLGCIIAELFLETPLFDYENIIEYKKNKEFPNEINELMLKIHNDKLKKLILGMIELDVNKRMTLDQCMNMFLEEICPITISQVLIHFNTAISEENYWKPDLLIGLVYKHWKQIWKCLYGINYNAPPLYQKLNFSIINKLILKPPFKEAQDNNTFLSKYEFLFDLSDVNNLVNEQTLNNELFTTKLNEDCSLLFINYILQSLLFTQYTSSTLVGMEMLKQFSNKLPDLMKLRYIIPYLVRLLKKNDNLTRLTALQYLIEILQSLNFTDLILPESEYLLFETYIFPEILGLYRNGETTLVLEFISIIDILIDLEEKFSNATLNSKIKNLNMKESNARKNSANVDMSNEIKEENEKKISIYYKEQNKMVEEFKKELKNVMEELMGGLHKANNELDVKQLFLRKFPIMLDFFGAKRENSMALFIINTLNDPQWIILQELFTKLPQMIGQLEDSSRDSIISLFDLAIASNLNELNNYKVLKAFNEIFEGGHVSIIKTAAIFEKALPLLVHPNIWIREEVLKLYENIIKKEKNTIERFVLLYEPIKDYLKATTLDLNANTLKQFSESCLCRVFYELEIKNYKYNTPIQNDQQKSFDKLKDIMNKFRLSNYKEDYHFDLDSKRKSFLFQKERTLKDPLSKEYNAYSRLNESEEEASKSRAFFGKIIWFADSLGDYSIPIIKSNNDLDFNTSNELISAEQFKLKLLFKMLEVSIKLIYLNELFDKEDEMPLMNESSKLKKDPRYYKVSKSYNGWRPEGQLISTLYEHENIPVERVVSLEHSCFCSVDASGKAALWKLVDNKDNTYKVEQRWVYKPKENTEITYNKTVTAVDAPNLIYASKNYLYKLSTQYDSRTSNAFSLLTTCEEGKDITCTWSFGSKEDRRQIIFCNQDGKINIFDQRSQKVDLSYNISKQKGIISCIGSGFDTDSIFIGTLGGYILHYDLRINTVTNSYKYQRNTPIVGLSTYTPTRYATANLRSMSNDNDNNKYLAIWTGANDHEIGLWNINSFNFDVLFKVNTFYDKETKPLTVEIPSICRDSGKETNYSINKSKETSFSFHEDKELAMLLSSLSSHCYNHNLLHYKRQILSSGINSDFYRNSNKHLNKIQNIYCCNTTVQNVVTPFCDCWENAPYLISAGNDRTIRYWDISDDGINNLKSYLINAPCTISSCVFKKSLFSDTMILQSNECYDLNEKTIKEEMPGLSEYQNYNGVAYHSFKQNEFMDSNNENSYLGYCTRIADASHKNTITDLLTLNLNGNSSYKNNLLISSSWDGSVKIWK